MTSWMRREIEETPTAVARFLGEQELAVEMIAAAARARELRFAVVCGRGSSGHAGTFLGYLLGTQAGLVAAEASPSIVSVYQRPLALEGALFVLISQSGRSADLVAMTKTARLAGAFTVAIVNDPDSPAARVAEAVLPTLAGEERSVPATKTTINAMVAGAMLVARLADDGPLREALQRLPARLTGALALDWSALTHAWHGAVNACALGRGYSLAIAQEIALKLAETARLPTLAYSSAAFMHGPRAALTADMPTLILRQDDETANVTDSLISALEADGHAPFVCGGDHQSLPWLGDDHPAADVVAMLATAYSAIESLARARELDPDAPAGLSKITHTT
jgi:glucosamine--fructose-6-phosphate aminotransferase (isomerizing)